MNMEMCTVHMAWARRDGMDMETQHRHGNSMGKEKWHERREVVWTWRHGKGTETQHGHREMARAWRCDGQGGDMETWHELGGT